MGGVFAVVHEGDGVAVEIGVEDGGIEKAVGMSAEDEVDATCAGNKLYIVDETFNLPAEVAEADDDVAAFTSTQDGDDAIGFGDGVEITDAFAVLVGYEALHRGADAKDTDAEALTFDDGIGVDDIFQWGGADVVVAADGGEGGKLEEAEHIFLAKVELMVADGGGIVMHGVHQAHLGFSAEEVVVKRALGVVATVEEDKVGIDMGAEAVNNSGATNVAAGVGLAVGLNAAVGVGGVEDEEGGRRRRGGGAREE